MKAFNKIRLELKRKKKYAEVLFIGDWHWGYPTCIEEKIKETLRYCQEKGIYLHLMGDLIESGITGSIGDSIYRQRINPQEQIDEVISLLKPLSGQITGFHYGNHEARIFKATGVDVAKIMAQQLNVPYLGFACWNRFAVESQSYSVYSLHGKTNARFVFTKLKAAVDISHHHPCDLLAMGHTHECASVCMERHYTNQNEICYKKQYVILTGHFLGYTKSYAQEAGMMPGKIGAVKVKFFSDKHDIHSSE